MVQERFPSVLSSGEKECLYFIFANDTVVFRQFVAGQPNKSPHIRSKNDDTFEKLTKAEEKQRNVINKVF